MMLPLCILVITVLLVILWWKWPRGRCIFAEDVHRADAAWTGGDVKDGVVYTKLAFEAAAACKDKYGEMRYNNANRIVAGEYVRTYLRETYPDLRVVDRVMHSTYAVELALLPTPFAAQASGFSSSSAVKARRGGSGAPR